MTLSINERLQAAGYHIQTHAKGRYTEGLIRLMGGLTEMDFLRDDYMVGLLSNAQLRKEKAFTYKQLQRIAKPESQVERFYEQMQFLTAKGMFLRGYSLQCPLCDLDTWYSLNDIGEHVICQGCRFEFQMPLILSFAYRPNRLLVEALKSGAMTIILTALWLYQQDMSMQWLTERVVHQGAMTTDIDIIAQVNNEILLIECKDNFKVRPQDLDALLEQLQHGQKIAHDIKADRYVFATLYQEAIPDRLATFLNDYQIELLTRRDLLRIL